MKQGSTYTPLHHKYRPQTFADLVGQEAIARTLSNAITNQQIAPAYLFTGARGTGKTSSARIMAKALNCLSHPHPTPAPCGHCELCHTIARSVALDITEIDAASHTGVDNIRELIERAQFAPVIARYKVYIIDECHMLSGAAFNALLKTLEEPPDRVVFILATTDPQRVLPTIISRCQRYDFRRIPLTSMVQHLTKIAEAEKINIHPTATLLIAQIAQGGLRDAESLLDQLSLNAGEITADAVWDLVGTVPERDLLLLLENISQGDTLNLLTNLTRILDRGREPLIILQNLANTYRDLLLAKMTLEKPEIVNLSDQGWEKLKLLSATFSSDQIMRSQQQLKNTEVQLKNTTQPRLWLEITLFELINNLQTSPISNAKPLETFITTPPKKATIAPEEPQTLTPSHQTDQNNPNLNPTHLWQELLKQLTPPTHALLTNTMQANILEIRDKELLIGLANPHNDQRKREWIELAKSKRPELQKAVKQILNKDMGILYKFSEATITHPTPQPPPASKPEKADSLTPPTESQSKRPPIQTREDIAVHNLADQFGGQVITLTPPDHSEARE